MDGGQVGVLKERNEMSLGGFLQSHHCGGLEAEIRFEVLSDFTDKPLEGKLLDKELSGLLVTPNLTQSDGTRTESVRLLDSSSGSLSGLPCGLGCEFFTSSLTPVDLRAVCYSASNDDDNKENKQQGQCWFELSKE